MASEEENDSPPRSHQPTLLSQTRRTMGSPPGDPFGLQEEIDAIKKKFERLTENYHRTRGSIDANRARADRAQERADTLAAQKAECEAELEAANIEIRSLSAQLKRALEDKSECDEAMEFLRRDLTIKDNEIATLTRNLRVSRSQSQTLAAASGLTELGANRKRTAVQASSQQENEARKKTREQIGELMEAAKYGDLAKVESLANANPSLVNESLTEGGPTALSQAHKYGHKQAVLALVGAMIA